MVGIDNERAPPFVADVGVKTRFTNFESTTNRQPDVSVRMYRLPQQNIKDEVHADLPLQKRKARIGIDNWLTIDLKVGWIFEAALIHRIEMWLVLKETF
jgi:hypothetical protein